MGGLAACGEPPTPFADYCEEQGRTIPHDERIIAALVLVSPELNPARLPHFAAFRTAAQSHDVSLDDRAIAQAYLARYPDCCEVVEPWVVTDYPIMLGGEHLNRFFEDHRDFHWSHDILIAAVPPGAPRKREPADTPFADGRPPVRIQSSSCGIAGRLRSG